MEVQDFSTRECLSRRGTVTVLFQQYSVSVRIERVHTPQSLSG